jgi:hypothetical protein
MKKNILLIEFAMLIIICSCLIISCGTPNVTQGYRVTEERQKENLYYIPAAPNTPLLTEKHDLYFDVLRSSGEKFSAFETQAAYMAGKNIGVCTNFSIGSNRRYREADPADFANSRNGYFNYHRFEAGAGYVKKFRGGWHFENYAGVGKEWIRNQHYTGASSIKLPYLFLQPTIAVSNPNQTVQFGVSSRFTGASFNVANISFDTARESFSSGQIGSLNDRPFHVMWEPSIVFRFGWKNILFHTAYAYSADLTNPNLYRAQSNFSIGMACRLNTKGQNKPKVFRQ